MRKVRVWKDDFTGSWRVQSGSLLLDPDTRLNGGTPVTITTKGKS